MNGVPTRPSVPRPTYLHTQPGTLIRVALGLSALFIVVLSFSLDPRAAGARWLLLVVGAALVVALGLFHALEVRVDEEAVGFRFGIGWIKRRIPLAQVRSARAVRNPWYYGWGIHLMPCGWIYNVSGSEAVELELEGGKRLRIGTDEPQRLASEIEGRLRPPAER